MKKKICAIALALTCFVGISKVEAKTAATLPTFDVTLNGQRVDNTYSQYPLLVYKDITYFPMTYNTSRFLGLETAWNTRDGLAINRTGVAGSFDFYNTNTRNSTSYQVSIPNFRITVNGKEIDNQREMYPLLIFRDITYFPMTWRFGVDEFGWDYDFTPSRGLVINARRVEPSRPTPTKPVETKPEYTDYSKTEYYNGYYYVVKTNGTNYRLFRESHVGGRVEQVSDMEIKGFTRDGDYLYFTSGSTSYKYSLKTGKIEQEARFERIDADVARVVTIAGDIYYVDAKDSALYDKDKRVVNDGAVFVGTKKVGDYTIVEFAEKSGADRNQIYDSRGRVIYETQKSIFDPKIERDQLVFYLGSRNGQKTYVK